jgi:hypothetical protein
VDLTTRTTSYAGSDHSWLGSDLGFDKMDPIEIRVAAFATDFEELGYIPSGVALGVVTSSGLHEPYDDGNSPAGVGTGVGLLGTDVHVHPSMWANADAVLPAALFWIGEVHEDKLPTDHGVDANFKADVARIKFTTQNPA